MQAIAHRCSTRPAVKAVAVPRQGSVPPVRRALRLQVMRSHNGCARPMGHPGAVLQFHESRLGR